MAVPSSASVVNLTRCRTYPGVFPGGYCDQFIRKIPFERVDDYGPELLVNRATLGGAGAYAAGGTPSSTATAAATTTFTFRRLGGTAEADMANVDASPESQAMLVEMKRVAVIRQLASQVITGDGTGNNMSGLGALVDAAQTLDPAAGTDTAPTLDDYYRLMSMVCASDGITGAGPDAILAHPRTRRQILALLDAAGGPVWEEDDELAVRVPLLGGVPVYFSQNVPTDELSSGLPGGTQTSVYALKFSGPTGVRVLHQGGESSDFGVVVDEIPPQFSASVRAATVRGFYTVLLPEVGSLARLKAINIAAFPS